jgi:hypothetical protein
MSVINKLIKLIKKMSEQLKDKAMKKSGCIKTLNRKERKELRKERKVFIYYQIFAPFAKNLCGHCSKTINKNNSRYPATLYKSGAEPEKFMSREIFLIDL